MSREGRKANNVTSMWAARQLGPNPAATTTPPRENLWQGDSPATSHPSLVEGHPGGINSLAFLVT